MDDANLTTETQPEALPAPPEDVKYYPVAGGNPNPDYYRIGENGEKIEITRSEFKEYRRKHVTVRHQTIPMCGHKFVQGREPRHRSCESCWFTFFQVHGELTQSVDEVFSKFGEAGIRQLRGPKFARNYLRFMSTVAQWKKAAEEAAGEKKEDNGNQQSPTGLSVSGGDETVNAGEQSEEVSDTL